MDERLKEVIDLVIENGDCRTSLIQRRLMLGYNRACRIVDQMEKIGVVGQSRGAKPRDILIFDKSKIDYTLLEGGE